ncbi:MAG: hypothetical protein ACYSX1_11725 [Planctomycetota bacterium]|jgi:hypothetical protein
MASNMLDDKTVTPAEGDVAGEKGGQGQILTIPASLPSPLHDISDGGSGCAADALSGNPWPNLAVVFFGNTCEAGMMCRTVENRFVEWRATVAVCQNSGKRWLLGVSVQLSRCSYEITCQGRQTAVAILMRY